MAKSKWEELLPLGSVTSSRSELMEQVVTSTAGGKTQGSGIGGGAQSENGSSNVAEQLTSLAAQMGSLASAQQAQTSALLDNTQALAQNSSSKGGTGSSIGNTVESAASSLLGGGLSSLSPLIGGILSLFVSGGQSPSVALPYVLPAPAESTAGVTANAPGQVVPVSYGETGQPRAQSSSVSPQVTVQVNAMDSQSFLDHSEEIAMAVKQAILNSSSLNDVISGL